MAELRYNPISMEWVMVASHRQARPQMPKDWCPFCPGSGKVPDGGFDVLRYQNDYPALSTAPPEPDAVAAEPLFRVKPAYGRCEVLLYSDKHDATLSRLPAENIRSLASMWRDVYLEMAGDPEVRYAFIFENRGDVVGVTMPHPHGQAYGYSFIPKKIEAELCGAKTYFDANGGDCLYCALLNEELRDGRRIIFENDHYVTYVPFFSPITYGVHVTAKRHLPHLGAMSDAELFALGEALRDCSGMYDALFDKAFPYMMCMYNAPTGGGADAYHHFHVKFYPPMRGADRQQFFASSETGAGAWCNPNCPEEKAAELRDAYNAYVASHDRI
ncbi:MAG: galactose-1-phosphate uridylyltransferase [Oscillospiraceae bacterium]|nr:galactose-1-phosphate uridylyltransferase [Oscillospiraceae bacterium]